MIPRPVILATVLAIPVSLAAQQAPAASSPPVRHAGFDSATVAWDSGNYPDALARFARLLGGADAERLREPIALWTGELFVTRAVAPDGRRLRWSPDGRFAAVEYGITTGNVLQPVAPAARTQLFRLDGDSLVRVRELAGAAAAFSGTALGYARAGQPGVRVLDLGSLQETEWSTGGAVPLAIASDQANGFLVMGRAGARTMLLRLTGTAVDTVAPAVVRAGFFAAGTGGRRIAYLSADTLFVVGSSPLLAVPQVSAATVGGPDQSVLAFVQGGAGAAVLYTHPMERDEATTRMIAMGPRLGAPSVSPDGRRVAFQKMPREDWELFVVDSNGANERRLTREIQHDLLPEWLGNDVLLEKIGEARHRRSYLIDVASARRTRVFHNNLLRTVSMEYAWAPSPDGSRLLIVADRDGNTISPERAVYLTDLTRQVTVADVRARVDAMAAGEAELRRRGARAFAPLAAAVRGVVAGVSAARIDRYAHDLYAFDSKYITQPGNRLAIEYLAGRLREWGYEPELQWFEPRGTRTANVIATLRGTTNPDLVYVVSSHFDSVEPGPGADDNSSGTTALLEAARALATRPQAATIQFAFFTGEEGGLLGSREFVRRAVRDSVRLVGALNNDMIGFQNDHRLDNTIRYSNDGIRDIQHAAAIQFTRLVTYDSRYYQSTDAHAYYEAYGDIVGGIGSYPILGNPHYHQSHDALETIGMDLVAEVSKTTVATLMLLASSPARLAGLAATAGASGGGAATASWNAAPERGVRRYLITYGPPANPRLRTLTSVTPRATLPGAAAGWVVAVKAVLASGLEGWDWARTTVSAAPR